MHVKNGVHITTSLAHSVWYDDIPFYSNRSVRILSESVEFLYYSLDIFTSWLIFAIKNAALKCSF